MMKNTCQRLGEGIYVFTNGTSIQTQATKKLKRVTILGGIHGNETIGVKVLDTLRYALGDTTVTNEISIQERPIMNQDSILTLIYGNLEAIKLGTRGSKPHADLNRCFTMDCLEATKECPTYEEQRAQILAPFLADSDVLIDIHSTNKPSEPFLRIAGHPSLATFPSINDQTMQILNICTHFSCKLLLHDPHHLLANKVALTDEFTGAHGGLGICFESGVATDDCQDKVLNITESLWKVLQHETKTIEIKERMNQEKDKTVVNSKRFEIYEITEVFKLTDDGFQWAEGIGEYNFQKVSANKDIGYIGSNGNQRTFAVDYDAYIVFPKVASLWKVGSPLGWLTKRVNT